jgi:glycosyltransferase involved in cell wall biosynthesis
LRHLIKAFASPAAPPVPLLIAGPGGWGDVDVAQIASSAGVGTERVRSLGFVSEGDLAVLYDRASAFVMPSLAEGFGLPIVEAFAHGTPVIHSDAPALVEVSGGAGVTVPIADIGGYPERLAHALADVLETPGLREELSTRGLGRAGAFDWSESATKVWRLHAGGTPA